MFEDLNKFLTAQIHAIEKSIYIASEKANRNLRLDTHGKFTEEFLSKWINKHADKFRDAWSTSICKKCKRVLACYDCLKEQCNLFDQTEN
jgi:hypothetical protein